MSTVKRYLSQALFVSLLLTSVAQAQQVLAYFVQIPASTPDWNQIVQVPGFDSSLGALTQVKLSFAADVWQSLYAENRSCAPSTYDLSTSATLNLSKFGGPALITFDPVTLHRTGSLAAFDGKLNYAGASGFRFCQ